MLLRISLILAVVAGLAVGVVNFVFVRDHVTTLQTNLKEQTDGRQKAEGELASTRKDLEKTTADLKTTKQNLETANADKEKALAEAESQSKRADKLNEDLNKTRTERDDAQAELSSYKAIGVSAKDLLTMKQEFRSVQDALEGSKDENRILGQNIKKLENRLAKYEIHDYHVPLPASLMGKVVETDPKWKFVVLNVGENLGVLEDGELYVNRDGKLVAKVKVTSVQKDRCVANLVPGWEITDVYEGDQVIPAYPAS
jgi:cell shape-determining protein MreC